MAHAGQFTCHRFEQEKKGQVEAQYLIVCIGYDPGQLARMEFRIERMQHPIGTGHGVVQLHVVVAVPRQRGHAIARSHAERQQGLGHLSRTGGQIAIGVAMDSALDLPRHDFLLAMMAFRMPKQRRDKQRLPRHLTMDHEFLLR